MISENAAHISRTDNRVPFAGHPRNRNTLTSRVMRFDRICKASGIEHQLTKPTLSWANSQVEWRDRMIKEATDKRFARGGHNQRRRHLKDVVPAHTVARKLRTLNSVTPNDGIRKI